MQDPNQGKLRTLVSGLDAPRAEMIAEDLRDLQIPALVRGSEPALTEERLEILVPADLHDTAARLLDEIWPERDRR